jgi:molybdopterin/thiamine biosynthesis adenylyltransferase/rhodanese-related sulfurtransferase
MLNKNEIEQYSRHLKLAEIGLQGQSKLKSARVLIVGVGGLGCPVAQYLTAAGVGTIGLVDGDTVDLSNLQRQILFDTNSIGKNKAITASERLKYLNENTRFEAFPFHLDSTTSQELITHFDMVIDCTDNLPARYLINDVCIQKNKPFVYAAIYKFEGQVSVFNYKEGPSYRCLFPQSERSFSLSCDEVGVMATLPGIIGSIQANEALKVILKLGEPLTGKLLTHNALSNESETLKIDRNQEQIDIAKRSDLNSEFYCETNDIKEISYDEIFAKWDHEEVEFIDLREKEELVIQGISGARNIPFTNVKDLPDQIVVNKYTILYCASGVRSKKAMGYLKKHSAENVYSLKGGLKELHLQKAKEKIEI